VAAALAARQPMQLEWAQGRATFGGNRRVLRDGKWVGFGLQRNGPVDHSLPVLAARDASGKVRAVWANYACHCTTVGPRIHVGGDWAGYANESMAKAFPEAVALMSIGCGADVGPQPEPGAACRSPGNMAAAWRPRSAACSREKQPRSPIPRSSPAGASSCRWRNPSHARIGKGRCARPADSTGNSPARCWPSSMSVDRSRQRSNTRWPRGSLATIWRWCISTARSWSITRSG